MVQANANDVPLALSNPCFEIWLLLHFQDQTAPIDRQKVQRACRAYLNGFRKALTQEHCQLLANGQEDAVARAQHLETWQQQQDRDEWANPSTSVYRLAEEIRHRGTRA
jgi:hypothetical protein